MKPGADQLGAAAAEVVLEEAHKAAELPLEEEVHGTEILQPGFDPLIILLLNKGPN
jgi:hypothetical protein